MRWLGLAFARLTFHPSNLRRVGDLQRICQEWPCQDLVSNRPRPVRSLGHFGYLVVNRLTIPRTLIIFLYIYDVTASLLAQVTKHGPCVVTGPTLLYQTPALHGLCAGIPLV